MDKRIVKKGDGLELIGGDQHKQTYTSNRGMPSVPRTGKGVGSMIMYAKFLRLV